MRGLFERGGTAGGGQAGAAGGSAQRQAASRRLRSLEATVADLQAQMDKLARDVARWRAMESDLKKAIAYLRSDRFRSRHKAKSVPTRAETRRRDPTTPPVDPALAGGGARGSGGSGGGSAEGGSEGDGSGAGGGGSRNLEPPVGLHLVSYANPDNAQAGWQSLQERYGQQLGGLERRMATVTLPNGKTFHRLIAGPIDSLETARQRCQQIQQQGQYCAVTDFVGVPR